MGYNIYSFGTRDARIKLWKLSENNEAKSLEPTKPVAEDKISELLEKSPWIIGDNVALLKREFNTGYGTADLVYVTSNANLIIVEVKRGGKPEGTDKAIYQLLNYGYWASKLRIRDLRKIVEETTGMSLSDFLKQYFSIEKPEDLDDGEPVNYLLLLVAPEIDYRTVTIIEYLKGYNVPIDALTLHYFKDPDTGEGYLARIYYTGEGEERLRRYEEVISSERFLEIMDKIGHRKLAEDILGIFEKFIEKYKDKDIRFLRASKTFGVSLCNKAINIYLQVLGADQGYHGVWVKRLELRKKVAEIARKMGLEEKGFEIREPNNEVREQKIIVFGRRGAGKTLADTIEDLEKFKEILPELLEKLVALC